MSVFGSVGSLDLDTGVGKDYFAKFDKLSDVGKRQALGRKQVRLQS